jgi:hypothetical protein
VCVSKKKRTGLKYISFYGTASINDQTQHPRTVRRASAAEYAQAHGTSYITMLCYAPLLVNPSVLFTRTNAIGLNPSVLFICTNGYYCQRWFECTKVTIVKDDSSVLNWWLNMFVFFELHNTSETLTTHTHSSLWIHARKPYCQRWFECTKLLAEYVCFFPNYTIHQRHSQ